jgi:membrane-bound ClpP family serine protease
MFKHFKPIDLFGYVGAVLIIVGFALLSLEKVGPHDALYLVLNLFGGIGIVITAFTRKDYPSGVLNVVFSAIALISLIALLL